MVIHVHSVHRINGTWKQLLSNAQPDTAHNIQLSQTNICHIAARVSHRGTADKDIAQHQSVIIFDVHRLASLSCQVLIPGCNTFSNCVGNGFSCNHRVHTCWRQANVKEHAHSLTYANAATAWQNIPNTPHISLDQPICQSEWPAQRCNCSKMSLNMQALQNWTIWNAAVKPFQVLHCSIPWTIQFNLSAAPWGCQSIGHEQWNSHIPLVYCNAAAVLLWPSTALVHHANPQCEQWKQQACDYTSSIFRQQKVRFW